MSQLVLREDAGAGVCILTLNRPEARNPLGAELRDEFLALLRQVELDDGVRALVITGAGGHFCSGGDIKTMGNPDPLHHAERMDGMCRAATLIGTFPKPMVAAVAGHAAGAGVSLACLTDVVVAQRNARFTVSFLKIGLGPDYGLSHTLPARIGESAARRMMLTRETMPADEAHRLGLVDRLCEDGEVMAAALEEARRLAEAPVEAARAVKAMMTDAAGLVAALDREARLQRVRFRSGEHREGIAAFKEKRPPRYHSTGD
jgi:enoyl-CoA hydratase/carnithine racemase